MSFTKMTTVSAVVALDTLLKKGCLVFYPRYHHHFPIIDAKLIGSQFVGIHYKIEHEDEVITFEFDDIFQCDRGIYFMKDNSFCSYCLELTTYMCGSHLEETQEIIQRNRKDSDIKKICKRIFEKYS